MPENRRRFFRVRASLRFTFAWEGGFELFRTVDVSACGALIRIPPLREAALPPTGALGECAFNLESMEIRTTAKVIRVTRTTFAVEFEDLRPAFEDRICGWAFRQETRRTG